MWRRREDELELPIDREEVVIILGALFEIRTNTRVLVHALTDEEDNGSGEEEED